MTELRKEWEGRKVDGLRCGTYLGGSDHSAVFRTQGGALKLVQVDPLDPRLAIWERAARLSHPHVARLLAMGRCEGDLLYVVTEYAEEDLSQVLPERALTEQEAREMLAPLVEGLEYLHANGFVHSRLKPSNLLVVDGQLKLSCDGVVPAGERLRSLRDRSVYHAPEAFENLANPSADVWSLGATLVEALTQQAPGENGAVTIPETIPAELKEVVAACLEPDPRKRITLKKIRTRLKLEAPPAPRGRKWLVAPIAAGVVLILAGAIALFNRHPQAQPQPAVTAAAPAMPAPEPQPRIAEAPPAVAETPPPPAAAPPVEPAPAAQPQQPPPAAAVKPEPPPEPPKPAPRARTPETSGAPGAVLEQVMPEVPARALHTIRGKVRVTVRLDVDAAGRVANARIENRGPSQYFATQALHAARQWRFAPAAASEWIVRFDFRPKGPEAVAKPTR